MLYIRTDWMWRNEDNTGDEWTPVKSSTKQFPHDHEDAAEAVAKHLTNDDADYYRILERDGIEMEIRSPEGEVKKMRAGGYADFVYTAEEV